MPFYPELAIAVYHRNDTIAQEFHSYFRNRSTRLESTLKVSKVAFVWHSGNTPVLEYFFSVEPLHNMLCEPASAHPFIWAVHDTESKLNDYFVATNTPDHPLFSLVHRARHDALCGAS